MQTLGEIGEIYIFRGEVNFWRNYPEVWAKLHIIRIDTEKAKGTNFFFGENLVFLILKGGRFNKSQF